MLWMARIRCGDDKLVAEHAEHQHADDECNSARSALIDQAAAQRDDNTNDACHEPNCREQRTAAEENRICQRGIPKARTECPSAPSGKQIAATIAPISSTRAHQACFSSDIHRPSP